MFFQNKTKKIELLFNLEFAQGIDPNTSVDLGISYADLSFYNNERIVASYVYPQNDNFIVQYSGGWILRFYIEKVSWLDNDKLSYFFVVLGYNGEPLMTQKGVVHA